LYDVVFEEADDPEAKHGYVWTTAEIAGHLPNFAELFVGDGTESLTYTHELSRIRIEPIESFDEQATRRCWCGGADGEHEADAHAEEGRWP